MIEILRKATTKSKRTPTPKIAVVINIKPPIVPIEIPAISAFVKSDSVFELLLFLCVELCLELASL